MTQGWLFHVWIYIGYLKWRESDIIWAAFRLDELNEMT